MRWPLHVITCVLLDLQLPWIRDGVQHNIALRLLLLTASSLTVLCNAPQVTSYPVIRLPKEKLMDTNGAGDAFVGGFLSQIVQGKIVEQAISAANFAANTVIQRSGCTFPPECTFSG